MDSSLAIPAHQHVQRMVKRAVDVAGAVLGLVIFSPVFALVSLLIALDSPGSIFFCQQRVGANGRLFKLVKFRTMRAGAGEGFQEFLARSPALRLEYAERQKLARDPRLTCVGRFLRRSSLDELPQLWNVLRGE